MARARSHSVPGPGRALRSISDTQFRIVTLLELRVQTWESYRAYLRSIMPGADAEASKCTGFRLDALLTPDVAFEKYSPRREHGTWQGGDSMSTWERSFVLGSF